MFRLRARVVSHVVRGNRSLAVAVGCILMTALSLSAQESTVFHANVNLVHVIATVRNKAGDLVGALGKDDFGISDNGVPQEIAIFSKQTDQPLSVALLIDVSGSTAKDLKFEIDSASRFLRALLAEGNLEDRVALYSFDDTVRVVHSYTHNFAAIDSALKKVGGSAGTSLYDAIYLTAHDLELRQGRKVMVIISDGGNTTSRYDTHQALEAAQMADTVIYPVIVMPVTSTAGRNIGGENALKFMADGTGGRTFLPSLGKQLDKAFDDIVTELRTEYVMGFYPRNVPLPKEPFHRLEVTVKRPELQVSARNGYYGESEPRPSNPDARISVKPDTGDVRKKKH
jgi:Ca-activated chloride channel family protein